METNTSTKPKELNTATTCAHNAIDDIDRYLAQSQLSWRHVAYFIRLALLELRQRPH